MVRIIIPSPSWDNFKAGLVKGFQLPMLKSLYELLLNLRQNDIVEEFHDNIELYGDTLRSEKPY